MSQEMIARITVNPNIMGGAPCVRGTRVTVDRILRALATGSDRADLKLDYENLTDADIDAALWFAAERLKPLSGV